VMGSLVFEEGGIEIWNTPKKNTKEGWIGIFNRSGEKKNISIAPENLGLEGAGSYQLRDVWGNQSTNGFTKGNKTDFAIDTNGVVFMKYTVAQ